MFPGFGRKRYLVKRVRNLEKALLKGKFPHTTRSALMFTRYELYHPIRYRFKLKLHSKLEDFCEWLQETTLRILWTWLP